MKGDRQEDNHKQKPDVNANLNAYVGKDVSPKKTEHINSISEYIKRAIKKFQPQTSER